MSNANNGFAGWMKKNPGMALGGFLFIVALIALIGWIVNRGSKRAAGPGAGPVAAAVTVPQLEVSGTKTVTSVNTSGYALKHEYADGTEYRGSNISFTITINTKGGFEENGIDKLKVIRYKADGITELSSTEFLDIKNYETLSKTFSGDEIDDDAVPATGGTNTFVVMAYTGETQYDPDPNQSDVQPLASTTVNISEDDLNYKLTTDKTSSFTFDVSSTAGGTIFAAIPGDITRTQYVLSIDRENSYGLIPVTGGYKFKNASGTFLTVDGVNVFKIDKFGEKYRLYSGDKIMTRTGGTGDVVLMNPSDMTPKEAEVALMTVKDLTGSRVYPPKPYPRTTPDNQVKNAFSWTVDGADYGNGVYRVEVSSSLSRAAEWQGVLDGEGLFDKGVASKPLADGADHAYHSIGETADPKVSWFHFHLPVYINLDNIKIVPRGYHNDSTDSVDSNAEINNMSERWQVYAQVRGTDNTITRQVRLYDSQNVTFEKGVIKTLQMDQVNEKFKEFKVIMYSKPNVYTVINEILFYGSNETLSTGEYIISNKKLTDSNSVRRCGGYPWKKNANGTPRQAVACDIEATNTTRNYKWELGNTFVDGVQGVKDTEYTLTAKEWGNKFCQVPHTEDEVLCKSDSPSTWETFNIIDHPNFVGYKQISAERGDPAHRGYCWVNQSGIMTCDDASGALTGETDMARPALTDSRTAFKFERAPTA